MRSSRLPVVMVVLAVSGCEQAGDDYLPLGDEKTLEYSVALTINDKTRLQKIILSDHAALDIGEREFFPRDSANGIRHYYYRTEQGVFSSRNPDRPGVLILPATPVTGQQWQVPTEIHILNSRHESFAGGKTFISISESITLENTVRRLDESVRVAAGRFNDCLVIESTGQVAVEARTRGVEQIIIRQTEWYALGTGLVKRVREEFTVPDKIQGKLVQELIEVR